MQKEKNDFEFGFLKDFIEIGFNKNVINKVK